MHMAARLTQRARPRLALHFGERFGKVGEQNREPKPEADVEFECEWQAAHAMPQGDQRRDDAADFDHEHHRIAP